MFTIDSEKLAKVIEIFNAETDPAATNNMIEQTITGDWNEGDEHQEWVDGASPKEIADWLASFYQ